MKQENYEYLSNQLKYLGFGNELLGDMQKNMEKGNDSFTLGVTLVYASFEKNAVQYDLNFRKGKEDIYFLNSYHATLDGQTAKFYVNRGEKNITSKEAFNLMEGRAVYRSLLTGKVKSTMPGTRSMLKKAKAKISSSNPLRVIRV